MMELSLGGVASDDAFHAMRTDEYTTSQDTFSAQHAEQNTSLIKGCILARYNETEYLPWDNPHSITSEDVLTLVTKIRDLTLALLFLIGGPANVVNMVVFFKQGLQDRVNLCVFMLALFDNLYLIAGFLLHSENIYLYLSAQVVKTPLNRFVTNSNLSFLAGSAYISFILSAIIACERCYCVLRPLRYQTLLRTRTMALIILCAAVLTYGFYNIVCFRYWIHCVYDPVTGTVFMKAVGSEFYRTHKTLIDHLDFIIFGPGVPGGTMLVVITATIVTTIKLRQTINWRTKTTSSLSPQEVALTKMLIANSVFFIICISPGCVFPIVCLALPEMTAGGLYHNFHFITQWILENAAFVKSSFNFFIYYSMGSRYRETLWELCGRNKHHDERGISLSLSSSKSGNRRQ